jgi:hypothetical protein
MLQGILLFVISKQMVNNISIHFINPACRGGPFAGLFPAVEVSQFGGQKAWPKLVHVVAGAQRRIIRYLEEGLYEAPTRTTLGESGAWMIFYIRNMGMGQYL